MTGGQRVSLDGLPKGKNASGGGKEKATHATCYNRNPAKKRDIL